MQTIKTLIHEIAHAKLHAIDDGTAPEPEQKKDRHTKEVEAESVALQFASVTALRPPTIPSATSPVGLLTRKQRS